MKLISTNYLSVLDSCVTPVLVMTGEGNIILANKKACEMFGYTEEEIVNLPVTVLMEELQPVYEYEHAKKKSSARKLIGIHKDGSKILLRFFSLPLAGNNNISLNVLSLWYASEKKQVASLIKSLKNKLSKAQEITFAVLEARRLEREEIGRELHDNVNQILAGACLYIGLLKREAQYFNPHIENSDMLVKKAIEELRQLSHSLVTPSLEKAEFMSALEDIISQTATGTSLSIDKEVTGFEEKRVSEKLWLTVFRIIQEQFNNIVKYAYADKIYLKLSHEKEALLLSIKDNGIGFDTAVPRSGIGLVNINSRANSQNGLAIIHSSPGNGCELKVRFKLG